jgi:hypothetical protein
MQVNRKGLIEALEVCKPALSTVNRAIEMGHYWFDGQRVSAFNGHLTISAPFDLDLKGGIPSTILDWLGKTSGETVTLAPANNELKVSAGRARFTFPLLDPKRQIIPEVPSLTDRLAINNDFVQALARVILSHDAKSSVPAKMGVFLTAPEDRMELYATDDLTLSVQLLDLPTNWPLEPEDFVVVPIGFIKQLMKFMPLASFYLTPNTVDLITDKDVRITGNLVGCPRIPNFANILDRYDDIEMPIPEEFDAALERVSLGDGPITITINKEGMWLSCISRTSRIEEEIPLPSVSHPDIMNKFDPKLLKRGIVGRTHLTMIPNGLRLRGPNEYTHIIAAVQ